jgi:hypothetical protein
MEKVGPAPRRAQRGFPALPRRGLAGASRWRFLVLPQWLAWHAFAVLAFWGMCWLGDWQLHRAIAGNSLSWAYTFEWPLFAIMGAFFWGKTIRDEFHLRKGPGPGAAQSGEREPGAPDVPGVSEAYDAYVARLNEQVRGHGRWHGFR